MTPHERLAALYYTVFGSGYRVHDDMTFDCNAMRRPARATGRRCRPAPAGGRGLAAVAAAAAVIFGAMPTIPAVASERWFAVEIIVFADLRDEALHAEHWPQDPGEPPLRGAVELTRRHEGEDAGALHAFRLVSRADLRLNPVLASLRRSEWYRPLLHAGWRLRGLRIEAARPARVGVHLDDGRAAGGGGGERPGVHGTVKVSLERYLHVDVDLLYRRADAGKTPATDAVPTRFRLTAEHRMRSGELHYIDHPLFGVLILIMPFDGAEGSAPDA